MQGHLLFFHFLFSPLAFQDNLSAKLLHNSSLFLPSSACFPVHGVEEFFLFFQFLPFIASSRELNRLYFLVVPSEVEKDDYVALETQKKLFPGS